MLCGDPAPGGEGGGREAREVAPAVVRAGDGGLGQGGGYVLEV